MKRFISLGLLAGCLVLASERPAQAWVNSKFSIGMNWHYQSGNNNLLWGLYRNGQVPGCFDVGPYSGPIPGPGGPHADNFPYYGAAAAAPAAAPAYAAPQTGPTRGGVQQAWQFGTIPSYGGGSYYQNASYPGYTAPNYGYTAPGYSNYPGYSSVPSYWYGQ